MKLLISFTSGFIFALGLTISGMTKPHKVIGFLDVFGHWDITLAFVMIGAILFHATAYIFIKKRDSPILEKNFKIPQNKDLDLKIILGSSLFGIGWAIAGYCPGPAIASVASLNEGVFIFIVFMFLGALIGKKLLK